MSYLNSVTLVGFVGADPEQRQARNNGSKFTVLSVATQRSWKNAEDEWASKDRVAPHRGLSSASGRTRGYGHQERLPRPRRRQPRQLDLRAAERQGQEIGDDQDHLVVHSRRCRAQARSRRTRAGSRCLRCCGTSSRRVRRDSVLAAAIQRASRLRREALFLFVVALSWPGSRPNSENATHAAPSYARCAPARCGSWRRRERPIRQSPSPVLSPYSRTPGDRS